MSRSSREFRIGGEGITARQERRRGYGDDHGVRTGRSTEIGKLGRRWEVGLDVALPKVDGRGGESSEGIQTGC